MKWSGNSYGKESFSYLQQVIHDLPTALQPLWTWPLFQFLNPYTDGRTPWTGEQPVARPLQHTKNNTNIAQTHTDIHVSSGIQTQDLSVQAGEDG
jgi:hypothetical protein